MTEQTAEYRTGYLGGSDMAAIIGLDKYRTRLHVYLSAIGEAIEEEETDAQAYGKLMESPIAQMVERRTGRQARTVEHAVTHPDHPYIRGHVDREFDPEHGIEIKNVGMRRARDWGPDGDPAGVAEYYLPQVHTYMALACYKRMTVAAYFGGADLRLYEVERDDELSGLIIASAVEFWSDHVEPRIPPDPDFEHAKTPALIKALYPGTTGEIIQADEDLEHWASVCRDAAEKAKVYESAAEAAKQHLLYAIGDGSALRFRDGSEFRRQLVKRKAYSVEATEYMQAKFAKSKNQE